MQRKLPSACSAAPLHKVYICTAATAGQVSNWSPVKNIKPSGQHPKPGQLTGLFTTHGSSQIIPNDPSMAGGEQG